jgi:hypothetical protein
LPSKSLSRSSLLSFQKYSSLLAGNDPYIPFTSDYDLLETEILTGTQASVTFSSLNSKYAADYQHLQLRIVTQTNRGESEDIARVAINNTYAISHWLIGGGVSAQSGTESSTYYRSIWTSGGSPTDSFGAAVIDILDAFETSKNKTVRNFSGFYGSAARVVGLASTAYYSTSSTDSVKFEAIGSWVAGSRFSLYGLKAA